MTGTSTRLAQRQEKAAIPWDIKCTCSTAAVMTKRGNQVVKVTQYNHCMKISVHMLCVKDTTSHEARQTHFKLRRHPVNTLIRGLTMEEDLERMAKSFATMSPTNEERATIKKITESVTLHLLELERLHGNHFPDFKRYRSGWLQVT